MTSFKVIAGVLLNPNDTVKDRAIEGCPGEFIYNDTFFLVKAPAAACGVTVKTPTGVEKGNVALHTGTGWNSRHRKGLEPPPRRSETTRPRFPRAFGAVPTTEVTKRRGERNGMGKNDSNGLQMRVPQELKRKLAMDAAKDCVTIRSLILSALVAVGYDIPEDEIRDKRKGRQ